MQDVDAARKNIVCESCNFRTRGKTIICNDNVVTICYAETEKGITMPTTSVPRSQKRDTLNLRIKPDERGLIERAAALAGKTRTDFVLEAARRAAVEALTERTLFLVDAETYARFAAALDTPPRPNDKLRRTMQTPAPWDEPAK